MTCIAFFVLLSRRKSDTFEISESFGDHFQLENNMPILAPKPELKKQRPLLVQVISKVDVRAFGHDLTNNDDSLGASPLLHNKYLSKPLVLVEKVSHCGAKVFLIGGQ